MGERNKRMKITERITLLKICQIKKYSTVNLSQVLIQIFRLSQSHIAQFILWQFKYSTRHNNENLLLVYNEL